MDQLLFEKWSVNESLLQSYRLIFISSQTFLIAVGALLLNKEQPRWLLDAVAGVAIIIWILWFQVVTARHRVVDYYKFQLDKSLACKFTCCSVDEYVKDENGKRKAINHAIGKKNWRPTRIKIDFMLPLIFTAIWGLLVYARYKM